MKKFLEVLEDDNGNIIMNTDVEFFDELDNPSKDFKDNARFFDKTIKRLIKAMTEIAWEKKNYHVSKAVRFLTLAETISGAQPYDSAEQLWSTMMFSFIPRYESFADKLKKPYGFNPADVTRPITVPGPINASMFPLTKPFSTKGMS